MPTARPALAHSYLRFSSPQQADGDSTRRQTALRDGWLKRHPHVRLDTSLTLADRGVSGFRGDHRTNKKHALAQYLDLVERGRVPSGSFLIVENLDRLTREEPEVSIPLVMNLIRAGVKVVQLAPAEMVYEPGMDFGRLMMMLWELARGHGESKRKSGLCGAAWAAKKAEARDGRKAHGKSVPAWLELVDGTYRLREDAARAVRLIFRWSAEGLGTLAIAARLNRERVPPIARGERWIRSYVAKVLDNRAAVGEYQPMNGHRNRKPDGDVIAGYFPAAVSEAEWSRAHAAKDVRNRRSGRPGRKGDFVFPFSGLVRCALDRCPLHVITRKGKRYLVSADAAQGVEGSRWRPFPLEPLTRVLLGELGELKSADLFRDPGGAKVEELTGRLAYVEGRLAVAVKHFDAEPENETWAGLVGKYDRERRSLARELAEARQEVACPLSAAWAEAVGLMARDEPDRLRQAILATVDSVWCVFVSRGAYRLAAVSVYFKGDPGAYRNYLVYHRMPRAGDPGATFLPTSVRHPDDRLPLSRFDLRDGGGDVDDAKGTESFLLSVPEEVVRRLLAGEPLATPEEIRERTRKLKANPVRAGRTRR